MVIILYFISRNTGLATTFVYRKLGKMISYRLPDPLQTRVASPPASIFHAHTREEYSYPEHKAPYLLVSNFGSCGDYILNGETVQASDQLFYFANEGDSLKISFRGRGIRETLLMMFDERMVREAAAAWLQSPKALLEDAHAEAMPGCRIPLVSFGFTNEFRQILDEVRRHAGGSVADGVSERVLAGFFEVWSITNHTMRKVPAANAPVRQELYKRLMLARAFMEANVEAELTVERIAQEAMLNRFYFLELFRKVFGITPYKYLRERKLGRARELLASGHSVTEVCQLVGYKSVGSFSNLFKDRFGCPPSEATQ
jgi:AraC family transcriptional regulator